MVMPIVTRALWSWLVPAGGRRRARAGLVGTLAPVGVRALAALVFWRCTPRIWHLP